ncbi:hypothetical protein CC80DRAFT_191373 [Byssothecium circinans]|uniref:Uncharacterized protein n=1 Tax=Byssothecium circinans TaxID=147558 RepID=A0A6A5THR5_9PLEO|nr:hypothetical protein CC80DRAFT_191373 [Byssothecium circinans]
MIVQCPYSELRVRPLARLAECSTNSKSSQIPQPLVVVGIAHVRWRTIERGGLRGKCKNRRREGEKASWSASSELCILTRVWLARPGEWTRLGRTSAPRRQPKTSSNLIQRPSRLHLLCIIDLDRCACRHQSLTSIPCHEDHSPSASRASVSGVAAAHTTTPVGFQHECKHPVHVLDPIGVFPASAWSLLLSSHISH